MKECLWNAIGFTRYLSSIFTVGLTAALMYPAVHKVPEESCYGMCYVQWPECWRSLLKKNSSYALKLEVASMPETLVTLHQSTGCHSLEDFTDVAMGMPELARKFQSVSWANWFLVSQVFLFRKDRIIKI